MVMDDATLLRLVEDLQKEGRYPEAAKLIGEVKDTSLITPEHQRIVATSESAYEALNQLETDSDGKWLKNSERHDHRDTVIFYRITPTDNVISCKVVMPMERSLLLPLLSVWNESQLYHTVMPRYTFPFKLGMSESKRLGQFGLGHQIIQVKIDMPYPFLNRECIQHVIAIDAIDEEGKIIVRVNTVDAGFALGDVSIAETEKGYQRVDMDATIVIESCPSDHYALKNSKCDYRGEEILLVTLANKIDAHVSGVPIQLINFFTRTMLGQMWASVLKVADDVREGKRPQYLEAIENSNPVLYKTLEGRILSLFEQHDKETEK